MDDAIVKFNNGNGKITLGAFANSFILSVEPRYGEPITETYTDQKSAEIGFGYYQHYFTR